MIYFMGTREEIRWRPEREKKRLAPTLFVIVLISVAWVLFDLTY